MVIVPGSTLLVIGDSITVHRIPSNDGKLLMTIYIIYNIYNYMILKIIKITKEPFCTYLGNSNLSSVKKILSSYLVL